MRRAIAPLILLLFLVAGCEKEKDPVEEPLDPSLHLTDGYCLVADEQVVLNHHDISFYDYGAHLLYLKDHISCESLLENSASFKVYAGGEEVYTMGTHPGYSSSFPSTDPFIWTFPTFYEDYILPISSLRSLGGQTGASADSREDSRIVAALKKYGQYREGLHCEMLSCNYSDPGEVIMKLKLSNRDEINYYYLDPEKMGTGLFHYFTNGLFLRNEEGSYSNHIQHVQPVPWDAWEMDWMSLLEGGSSVTITLEYKNFDPVPSGSYRALFRFPGLSHVARNQLDQRRGRIWLGNLELESVAHVE